MNGIMPCRICCPRCSSNCLANKQLMQDILPEIKCSKAHEISSTVSFGENLLLYNCSTALMESLTISMEKQQEWFINLRSASKEESNATAKRQPISPNDV